jgi:hypothetical protein
MIDSRSQQYLVYPDGQMRRLSEQGTPLPRIRMSKKERIKLRREYHEIRDLESTELANKIIETPVINPLKKDSNPEKAVETKATDA